MNAYPDEGTATPSVAWLWQRVSAAARSMADGEPVLHPYLDMMVLAQTSLASGMALLISARLATPEVSQAALRCLMAEAFESDDSIPVAMAADIVAVRRRDPACESWAMPMLFYKGFHAVSAHRVAHWLWRQGRRTLARWLQSRVSEVYGVDIHPAARIGSGIFLDHAHGFVVGETAVVEDNVSILHNVTLGGTGKTGGDRHPKVRGDVLIGAGAHIIGNIEIGPGAKVGAGSVVMRDVPAHTTVAGALARCVGMPDSQRPAQTMNQEFAELGRDGDGTIPWPGPARQRSERALDA